MALESLRPPCSFLRPWTPPSPTTASSAHDVLCCDKGKLYYRKDWIQYNRAHHWTNNMNTPEYISPSLSSGQMFFLWDRWWLTGSLKWWWHRCWWESEIQKSLLWFELTPSKPFFNNCNCQTCPTYSNYLLLLQFFCIYDLLHRSCCLFLNSQNIIWISLTLMSFIEMSSHCRLVWGYLFSYIIYNIVFLQPVF